MSLFDDIADFISPVTDLLDPVIGGISSAAKALQPMASYAMPVASYLGTQATNESNLDVANTNNAWSAQQYAKRYQTMTSDMSAAGLNPMLAYSQSAGASPTAQQVNFQNPMASATQAYQESKQRDVMSAQIDNLKSDTEKNNAAALLNKSQANEADERARVASATAAKTALDIHHTTNTTMPTQKALGAVYWSQIDVNKATLPKIAQEIKTGGAYAQQAYSQAYKALQDGKVSSQEFEIVRQAAEYAKKTGMLDPALRSLSTAAGAAASVSPPTRTVLHRRVK
jgi:hypothetical protein